jgi:hypothetical protein
MNLSEIKTLAREHASNVHADIMNASTRIEHIRLTRLAIEADRIASELEKYEGKS